MRILGADRGYGSLLLAARSRSLDGVSGGFGVMGARAYVRILGILREHVCGARPRCWGPEHKEAVCTGPNLQIKAASGWEGQQTGGTLVETSSSILGNSRNPDFREYGNCCRCDRNPSVVQNRSRRHGICRDIQTARQTGRRASVCRTVTAPGQLTAGLCWGACSWSPVPRMSWEEHNH